MASFETTDVDTLLDIYDRIMTLQIFVDGDDELKNKYVETANKHNDKILNNPYHIDAGFDLFTPRVYDPIQLYNYSDKRRFFGPYKNDLQYINNMGEYYSHFYDMKNKSIDKFIDANLVDYNICCSAKINCDTKKCFNTGYYIHPRSSLSKTKLRLANSTGIIDSGYRGHIMGMFDVVGNKVDNLIDCDYMGNVFDRYVQICAPSLMPILVEVVDTLEQLGEQTERGSGGFGSTGA